MISFRNRSKLVHVFISFRHFSSIKKPFYKPSQFVTTKNILNYQFVRSLSTKDVFFREIGDLASQVPSPPLPLGAKQTLAEMVASGVSVLEDLELWTWWKPSSLLCWGYEFGYSCTDLPWWAIIAASTVLIRVSLIFVTVKLQRFAARQSELRPEIDKFRERILESKKEGDHMLVHQIMMEQNDFLKQKGLSPLKYLPLVGTNCVIFMSQFFAIRGLATSRYPGFQDGGFLWFKDLSVGDPYWILPTISSVTLHYSGIDVGSFDTLSPIMRPVMLYGFPAVVLALGVYWVTNNMFSILTSFTFKIDSVRRILNLPKIVDRDKSGKSEFAQAYKEWKVKANIDKSSRKNTRQEDYEQFQKAGRGKPILLIEPEFENNEKIKLTAKKTS